MNVESMLERLKHLVSFDTQNPPRDIRLDSPIFAWIKSSLGDGFDIDMVDHGQGRISLLAVRGKPSLLFNSHLDTVPVIEGSRFPALELTEHKGRVYGRGACDIKGAAACLLEVAASTDKPMALLFTTDEEGNIGCCINEFVDAGRAKPFKQVVVTEPTKCKAVLSHRGFLSVRGEFSGIAGHSSEQRALRDNALHKLSNWSAAAIREAQNLEDHDNRPCFNMGEIHGGIKTNVIADNAKLTWSARLSPGDSNEDFLDLMCNLETGSEASWIVPFSGPPLPTRGMDLNAARSFIEDMGLTTGPDVSFWTEASLFARAGTPAIVLGPGDIAQAHAIDEWVSIQQLEQALQIYTKLVNTYD